VRLRAPRILIATGGRPQRPRIPGAELGGVSDDFFHLCSAPRRVALIGTGYVAVELAGVLQALGSQLELFARGSRLLGSFDAELSELLAEDYRQSGVHLHFGYQLQALERHAESQVRLREAASDGSVGDASEPFDMVLFATGREPNTDGLQLDRAGIATDARGHVQVDAWQATNVEGVYAVGDVTGQLALTPVAIAAARRLMDRLFDGKHDAKLDYTNVPTVVFAHPPIATVGLTEVAARALHGDAVQVFRTGFRPMLYALADVPQRSLFKLVCVGDERRIVGIHLLGEGADEIMQGFAVAMKRGITLDDLHDTVAIHPTSAEEVVLMQ
jgi:glutathione reductase (NADPH)